MDEKSVVSVPVTINLDAPESFSLWQLVTWFKPWGQIQSRGQARTPSVLDRRKAPEDSGEDSIEADEKLSTLKFLSSITRFKAEQLELATYISFAAANVAAMTGALQEHVR